MVKSLMDHNTLIPSVKSGEVWSCWSFLLHKNQKMLEKPSRSVSICGKGNSQCFGSITLHQMITLSTDAGCHGDFFLLFSACLLQISSTCLKKNIICLFLWGVGGESENEAFINVTVKFKVISEWCGVFIWGRNYKRWCQEKFCCLCSAWLSTHLLMFVLFVSEQRGRSFHQHLLGCVRYVWTLIYSGASVSRELCLVCPETSPVLIQCQKRDWFWLICKWLAADFIPVEIHRKLIWWQWLRYCSGHDPDGYYCSAFWNQLTYAQAK